MKAPADGAFIVNGESLRVWMTGVPVARCLGVSRRCVEGPYQDCGASGASVNQAFRIVPFRWLDCTDASRSAAESGHQLAQPAGLGRHHGALAVLEVGCPSGDKGEAPAAPTTRRGPRRQGKAPGLAALPADPPNRLRVHRSYSGLTLHAFRNGRTRGEQGQDSGKPQSRPRHGVTVQSNQPIRRLGEPEMPCWARRCNEGRCGCAPQRPSTAQ